MKYQTMRILIKKKNSKSAISTFFFNQGRVSPALCGYLLNRVLRLKCQGCRAARPWTRTDAEAGGTESGRSFGSQR